MRIDIPKLELSPPSAGDARGRLVAPCSGSEMVWRDAGGHIVAFGMRDGHEDLLRIPGVGLFRWSTDAPAVTAHPEPGVSAPAIVETFERGVLPLALQARGVQVLHASAVQTPTGVVAFCARSQTGKSTIAYACSRRSGYGLWADDAVAFDVVGNSVMAIPLPFNLKLRPASLRYFEVGDDPGPQPSAPREPCELVALFALERRRTARAEPRARRLSAVEAFASLLEHAYCFDLEDRLRRHGTVTHYLELSARVPTFALGFSEGWEALPVVLREIEAALDPEADPAPAGSRA